MTLALSTSSPLVSVALFDNLGVNIGAESQYADGAASGALAVMARDLTMLCGVGFSDITQVAVDVGPGGFTGVRVGVTFAKSLAWGLGVPVVIASAFDLVSLKFAVAVPFKKGQWLYRRPGEEPSVESSVDPNCCVGYGIGFDDPSLPLASGFRDLLKQCVGLDPVPLVPYYVVEPSISQPKNSMFLPSKT